jgi:hypothetical protein
MQRIRGGISIQFHGSLNFSRNSARAPLELRMYVARLRRLCSLKAAATSRSVLLASSLENRFSKRISLLFISAGGVPPLSTRGLNSLILGRPPHYLQSRGWRVRLCYDRQGFTTLHDTSLSRLRLYGTLTSLTQGLVRSDPDLPHVSLDGRKTSADVYQATPKKLKFRTTHSRLVLNGYYSLHGPLADGGQYPVGESSPL